MRRLSKKASGVSATAPAGQTFQVIRTCLLGVGLNETDRYLDCYLIVINFSDSPASKAAFK